MDSIIFDVDGTLWDSADSVAAAWNLAIKKFSSLDITLDREILGSVFGKTMTDIGDILFPSLSETEKDSLLSACCELENNYLKNHLCFGETGVSKGQTLRMLIDRNHLSSPVYVGDTQGDADACHAAGIPFIFAEYGFGNVPDAKMTIHKFSDLLNL
ncbi:HAD family hydrolase [[Ruminococcus] torques]|uniref:HAD family hydrolase n=1 Tax=[Ruminococcus] torques TaxID=33039 RepID=UPI003AB5E87E